MGGDAGREDLHLGPKDQQGGCDIVHELLQVRDSLEDTFWGPTPGRAPYDRAPSFPKSLAGEVVRPLTGGSHERESPNHARHNNLSPNQYFLPKFRLRTCRPAYSKTM